MKHCLPFLLLILITSNAFAEIKTYDITAYGAVPDGKTICTKALQATIDACNSNGGGDVLVPTGVYMIGTVHLKSNIHLKLQAGAILRGSTNLNDYEMNIAEKPIQSVHKGMLFTEDAENITISGEGQIDGNGDVFFDVNKAKTLDANTTRFTRQKNNYRHVDNGIGDGPIVPNDRPYQMFVFSNCKRITVKDIFITNAPFWCMLFADCDAVNINGIKLWNNMLAPNADGIDIASCNNVSITNCDIRCGDDAIAIIGYSSHFEVPGFRKLRHISENIIVSNCNLQSYSSGIRIGFLDQNSVSNIQVSNCNITNSTRGIGIFLRDEGSLQNISFSNMYIQTELRTGDWWGNGEPIHISAIRGTEKVKLGTIKNIQFNNITCKGENGLLLFGTPESIMENITFDHVTFELTDSKLNDVAGGNVDLRGCMADSMQLFARDIPGILMQYVNGVQMNDVQLTWAGTTKPYFTHGIEINNFKDVTISKFKGNASPINKNAKRIFATNGKGLVIDDKKGAVISNVQ